MRRVRLIIGALSTLLLASCGESGVAFRSLDAPENTQSTAWAIVRGANVEVSLHPAGSAVEVDLDSPVTLVVRFFAESLDQLGLPAGVLSPRTTEPVFGRLPAGLGDAVRAFEAGDDSGWESVEAAEVLSSFASVDLPPDPHACVDLEVESLFRIPEGGLVTGVLRASETSAIVFVQRERQTTLHRLERDAELWRLSPIDLPGFETVLSSSIAGAAEESGGILLSTCDTQAVGPKSVAVWSLDGDRLEPVLTAITPSCPTKLLPPTSQHPDLVLANGFEHDLLWYEQTGGEWRQTHSATVSGDRFLRGDGDTLFSVRQDHPVVYRFDDRQLEQQEPVAVAPADRLRGLMNTPWGPLLVTGQGGVLGTARGYLRSREGNWDPLFAFETQYWISSLPFQAGLLLSGYSGLLRQVSLRDGHCVPDEAFTTGVWRGNSLAPLDPYRVVVAGEGIADHTQHVVAVVRAKSR